MELIVTKVCQGPNTVQYSTIFHLDYMWRMQMIRLLNDREYGLINGITHRGGNEQADKAESLW